MENRIKRIEAEKKKLKTLIKELPNEKKKIAEDLIGRIAFMKITLEDLEADINENGVVEPFSQTPTVVYDRQRPAAQLYNSKIKNYASICKQLFEMLPNEVPKTEQDELMAFVKSGVGR